MIAGSATAVTTADVNGDGKPDLLGTNGSVSVRLGLGGGNFAPAVDYPAGTSPVAIAVADFNGDRKLDIATANLNSKNASVLLNQGNGTFAPKVDYATGNQPHGVAAGDLNRDGKPDLVVSNWESGTVSVLMNKGQGAFAAPVNLYVGAPSSIVVAELTGDSWPDIAYVADPVDPGVQNSIYVIVNQGFGKFDSLRGTFRIDNDSEREAGSLVAADLTGDGKLDLAVAHGGSGTVSVFVNKGRSRFESGVNYLVGKSHYLRALAAVDVTGDGKLDLVATNGYVNVLVNQGSGTFAPNVQYQVGASPESITGADFTGDGKADLAVGQYGTEGVALLVNQGSGTFVAPIPYPIEGSTWSPVAADISGDGKLDLVGIDGPYGYGALRVLTNQGNGTFGPPTFYEVPAGAHVLIAADFSGDGKSDLAFAAAGNVSVLINTGNSTFAGPYDYPVRGVDDMIAADVTEDGKVDIVIGRGTGDGPYDGAVSVLVNRDGGTFQPLRDDAITRNYDQKEIAVADVNGDGKLDFVAATFSSVSVMLNRGDGSFSAKVDYPVTLSAYDMVAADLTGDGKADIATVSSTGKVSVLVNQGDGTFAPKVDYEAGGDDGYSLVAEDVSGDGPRDLIVVGHKQGYARSRLTLLLNQGNGTFAAPAHYAAGYSPESVLAADLTGDGRLDLAVAGGGSISVLPFAGCLP
ncbi:FG-GAP repeat domain-containing protein [Pendulispora albinea]|uniref:VCBS repeat-containing protein n=1 Tax=Pendulispora albinea TaxID=2741071 RepID=A0ABZ2M7H8_9BACT